MKINISTKSRLLVVTLIILSIFSIPNSCKKASDVPGANEVFIQGMAFSPSTITVAINTTVTWNNKDGAAHNVTSNTSLFHSSSMNKNDTYSNMFSTAGTFPYYCTIHPSMTASVVVK